MLRVLPFDGELLMETSSMALSKGSYGLCMGGGSDRGVGNLKTPQTAASRSGPQKEVSVETLGP